MSHSMIRIKTKGVYIIYPCCYICLGGKAAGWQQSTGSANQIEGGCSSWGWENCSATRHLDLGGGSKWELHSGECLHVAQSKYDVWKSWRSIYCTMEAKNPKYHILLRGWFGIDCQQRLTWGEGTWSWRMSAAHIAEFVMRMRLTYSLAVSKPCHCGGKCCLG